MRSAVDALLKWHASIESPDLPAKLAKLLESEFRFFRGTFFLYADDLRKKLFSELPSAGLNAQGAIIGDVHSENFGSYRAVTGEIVYDVNDFDETTHGLYLVDAGRLAASLILGGLENDHRLGHAVDFAETALREWIAALSRFRKLQREDFERLDETRQIKLLLASAGEKSRVEFMKTIVEEMPRGEFRIRLSNGYREAGLEDRRAVERALPGYWKNCLAPGNANLRNYRLVDVAARVAGAGSLGRKRLAVLLNKGGLAEGFSSLRLIEWKESLDSALKTSTPRASRGRAREVFEATRAFQLQPKRYLGYALLNRMPVQAREIGSNDARFSHKVFSDPARFENAAKGFGMVLARCHLLASRHEEGARSIAKEIAGREDRVVHAVLRFAVNYAARTSEDYEELKARRAEVETQWSRQSRSGTDRPNLPSRRSSSSS
jgi:uncharacterized protein (DUF2252 family)